MALLLKCHTAFSLFNLVIGSLFILVPFIRLTSFLPSIVLGGFAILGSVKVCFGGFGLSNQIGRSKLYLYSLIFYASLQFGLMLYLLVFFSFRQTPLTLQNHIDKAKFCCPTGLTVCLEVVPKCSNLASKFVTRMYIFQASWIILHLALDFLWVAVAILILIRRNPKITVYDVILRQKHSKHYSDLPLSLESNHGRQTLSSKTSAQFIIPLGRSGEANIDKKQSIDKHILNQFPIPKPSHSSLVCRDSEESCSDSDSSHCQKD